MTEKKKNILYVVSAYGFFWAMLVVLLCLGTAGIIPLKGNVFEIFRSIACWAPTLVVLVFHKKLCPDGSVKTFYKNAFKDRVNIKLILVVTIVQAAVFFASAGTLSITKGISIGSLFGFSLEIFGWGILWTVFQGATGEESGWRGFLQPSLEKKHGVIQSSIIVGIIWAFWHTPLWLLEGFSEMEMVQYILSFISMAIAQSVIVGVCYSRCRNLFVAMWMHFMVNIFSPFLVAGGTLSNTNYYANYVTFMAVFYTVAAVGYSIWYIKTLNIKN